MGADRFVSGGGGMVVLEELEHAKARGARRLVERVPLGCFVWPGGDPWV